MSKIKLYLGIAGGTLMVILLSILGLQKWALDKRKVVIEKQKLLLKANEEKAKRVAATYKVKQDLAKKQKVSIQKEEEIDEKIEATETIEEGINTSNDIINDFNNKLPNHPSRKPD